MTLKLAGIFGDHMVVQRDIPLPIWGWSPAGATVTVAMAGHRAETTADAQGTWRTNLPALSTGGTHVLTVSDGRETITVRDIVVGEVWVCSGQSNMQWSLSASADADAEIVAANHPGIRLYTVPMTATLKRQADTQAVWQVCAPGAVDTFSAVGYFFGRELHRRLGVPIGLINSSWGGTLAEAWTSREGLLAHPSLKSFVTDLDRLLADPVARAGYQKALEDWNKSIPQDPGNRGLAQDWANPSFSVASWPTMDLPRLWQSAGLNFNGVLWFRKEIDLPSSWVGHDLTLTLGPCDKSDDTYFNNERVGGISILERADAWSVPRRYTIPRALLRPGRNVIAVRVFSNIYGAGFGGAPMNMQLIPVDLPDAVPLPLAGLWNYQVEHNFGTVQSSPPQMPPGDGNPHTTSNLFHGMIAPLVPFAIRGAIWYQGESNAGRPEQYRDLFPTLIRDWRKSWNQPNPQRDGAPVPDFPFLFVQLANYMARKDEPEESDWALLREAQAMALSLPNTGMAVTIDIGDGADIHPKNKQDVGRRLAFNALAQVYNVTDVIPCGPTYSAMKIEGEAIRLSFTHDTHGLVARGGGPLEGFTIAGEDKRFVKATAVIENRTVRVSSPRVAKPAAVRYAWADNPACNLTNRDGLPTSPFRTDTWPRPG